MESEAVKFIISQTSNSWTKELSITGWAYGEDSNAPTAASKYGTSYYKYSDKKDGVYTDTIPTTAGEWYVKAYVDGTDNYTALESEAIEFIILQAENKVTTELIISDWVYGTSSSLPVSGFKYGNPIYKYSNTKNGVYTTEVPFKAGIWYVKAVVEGTANYRGLESEPLEFKIAQAENNWTSELKINDWTYGDKGNVPTVGANFGRSRCVFSNKINGVYTSTIPTTAGVWYVKAIVDGTDNYTALESEAIEFIIEPKKYSDDSDIIIPEISNLENIKDIIIKDGDKNLVKDVDYEIIEIQKEDKLFVTIKFKGNYSGEITKEYIVNHETSKTDPTPNDKVITSDTMKISLWSCICTLLGIVIVYLKWKRE